MVSVEENLPVNKVKKLSLGEAKNSQIKSASNNVYFSDSKAGDNIVKIQKQKLAVSTFGGVPIPEKGAITASAFTDSPAGTEIKPADTEVWRVYPTLITVVNGSSSSNTITLQVTDGTTTIDIHSAAVAGSATAQLFNPATSWWGDFFLTSGFYLKVKGSQSDESICHVPYTMEAQ